MRALVPSRAARRFARSVDAPTRHSAGRADTSTRELVGIARQLQSVQFDAGPSEDFRAQLRQRLVAVATVQGVGEIQHAGEAAGTLGDLMVPKPRAPLTDRISATRLRAHRRVAFAAGALATLVLVGGLAVAESGRALPGDALYGLKRTTESVQLSLSGSDVSTGREHLSIASTRLTEVEDLVGRGDTAAGSFRYVAGGGGLSAHQRALVNSTLDDMDRQTSQGTKLLTRAAVKSGNTAPLNDLRSWAGKQRSGMHSLQQRVGAPTSDRVGRSISLLDHVVSRVGGLLAGPDCTCPAGSDALGPLPCDTCPTGPDQTSTTSADRGGASSTPPGSSSEPGSSDNPPTTTASGSPQQSPSDTRGTTPRDRSSTSSSSSPTDLPTAPSSSATPTPSGILPTGILPTDDPTQGDLLPSWLLPSLLPSNLLPIGN